MQIFQSRLHNPQVSTENCESSLSSYPLLRSKNTTSSHNKVVELLKKLLQCEHSPSLRTQVPNENYIVTYRVEIHSLCKEMDDRLPEHFTGKPSRASSTCVKEDDGETSEMYENRSKRVDAQGGDRKNPSDQKSPGDHNNGRASGNSGDGNDESKNEDDRDEEDEDEERKMSSPYSSKHRYGEILRRKNKAVLIINLYPPERGYTYCCCARELEGNDPNFMQVFKESHEIPYSETYILDCIDQETVPLRLIQKLEKIDGVNLMRYLGCVVCEIRDYRRFASNMSKRNTPVVKKVLLKPTNHTLFSELNHLITSGIEDRKLYKRLRSENGSNSPRTEQDCVPESQESERDEGDGESRPKRPKMSDTGSVSRTDREPVFDDGSFDKLSLKQRLEVEKQLLLRTYSGLCLDPSKSVGLIANVRQFERYKWNTPDVKNVRSHSIRTKQSQNSQSQKVPLKIASAPKDTSFDHTEWETIFGKVHKSEDLVQFHQFVKNAARKLPERVTAERANPLESLKLPPINFIEYPAMTTPSSLDELARIGKPAERATHRPIPSENCIRKVDEYILETERRKRPHSTKLSIYQRNGTESYFGELEQESFAEPINNTHPSTLRSDSLQNADTKPQNPRGNIPSTKCQFELGSLRHVQLYVRQFTDIFTEDGRRPCKITYQKVGQNPHVMYIGDYSNQNQNGQNRNPNNNNANTPNNNPSLAYKPPQAIQVKAITAPPSAQVCAPPATSVAAATPIPIVTTVSAPVPVVNSSASPTSTTPQPPVQIVHPQPRSIQQVQIPNPQIHYSIAPQTAAIMQPPQSTLQATGTNVNLNLNLNSARVVHQQPLLTRPQIINVNLQQSTASLVTSSSNNTYTVPKIQTAAQLHQHQQQQHLMKAPSGSPASSVNNNNSLRLKQPMLATLLLAPNPKPITVIQPQPQNPSISQPIQFSNSAMDHQKQQHLQQQLSQIMHQSQQAQHLQSQHQQTSQQQPIMIITNTNHQQHNGSVSLNLNTISLDSLLNAQQQQSYVTTASLISPSTSNNPAFNGLNTILRFSNNNAVTLTPQQQQILRQNALSLNMNPANSGATILNPGIIINSAPSSISHQSHVISNSNMAVNRTATISVGPSPQGKCHETREELNVPDLHSLLNSSPSTSNAAFRNQAGGATATIDGRGLNLDLNLNLNLNLGGAPAQSSIAGTSIVNQNQNQIIYDSGNNTVHQHQHQPQRTDSVDSLFNALSEVIGPELGQKLDGAMRQGPANSGGANVVTSSLSPTKPAVQNNSNSSITLNDLLGSPPIMVSSTHQHTNGISLQSPQSPSITSILSPISPNVGANAVPYSTTPRLSALLAGTPSADSSGLNRFDPSAGRGANVPTSTSYGNLLDRLVASSGQTQVTQRTSRLNPIATATPMLASSLGTAPLNARQGSGTGGAVGLARPTAYRQIAPAPPPNRPPAPQPQQQLINVIGYVGNNNPNTGTTAQGQPTIRVVNNSSQGTGGNLGNR